MQKKKGEENGEEVGIQSLQNFFVSQVDKFFVEHIPIDSFKEMNPVYMYTFGSLAYAASIALFIYFTVSSYESNVSQAFISLTNDVGLCSTVPISVTNSYLGDTNGNWIGSADFNYYLAAYSLTLSGFSVSSTSQYVDMMTFIQQSLITMGQTAKTKNLGYNIMLWISFVEYYSVEYPTLTNFSSIGSGQLQYFELAGNPYQVFDLSFHTMGILSTAGFCPVTADAVYDRANGDINVNLNYADFSSNAICMAALTPSSFGYVQAYDVNDFSISLHVDSFITAMSVNLGIMDIADLIIAQYLGIFINVRVGNQKFSYVLNEYFDIRFNTMIPIYCMRNVTALPANVNLKQLCFVNIANSKLGLPVFNHYGNTKSDVPDYCDCKTNGHSQQCNQFAFLSGYVVYNASSLQQNVLYLGSAVVKWGSYEAFNRQAYNASFAAAAITGNAFDPVLNSSKWLKNAFQFCNISGVGGLRKSPVCSVVVFNSFDSISQQVSDYHYALSNGSCTDSFTIPENVWAKFLNTPPTQLQQDYYSCYPSSISTLQTAFGVASGNTATSVPILVFMVLPLVYYVMKLLRQIPPPDEFSAQEKSQVNEVWSILLLRLRDKKTRGFKKRGLLLKLYREVQVAAQEVVGGYSDSDDESDEDEEDDEPYLHRNERHAAKSKSKAKSLAFKADSSPDSDDEPDQATIANKEPFNGRRRSTKKRQSNKGDHASAHHRKSALGPTKMDVFLRNPTAQTEKVSSESSPGVFGFMFGRRGSAAGPVDKRRTVFNGDEIELVVQGVPATANPLNNAGDGFKPLIGFDKQHLPADVTVLNALPKGRKTESLSSDGKSCDEVVQELHRVFSELVSSEEKSSLYETGVELALRLRRINIKEITTRMDRYELLAMIANAMCIHGSVALNKTARQMSIELADKISYDIGGQYFTLQGLSSV